MDEPKYYLKASDGRYLLNDSDVEFVVKKEWARSFASRYEAEQYALKNGFSCLSVVHPPMSYG